MNKNITLKIFLAALTVAGASSSLVGFMMFEPKMFEPKRIKFTNTRNIGGVTGVTISAKQIDGAIVTKGTILPPTVKGRRYNTSFLFNPTDTIIINGGDYQNKDGNMIKLPPCEIKAGYVKPNTRIIIHDNDCEQK